MDNRYKKLFSNTGIIALGSFGSKVLSFLIVPFYTYVLTTSDYGVVDLFMTTMSLMIPFTTLLVQESIVRFLVAKEYDEKAVLNNSLLVFMAGTVSVLIIVPLLIGFFPFKNFLYYFLCYVILCGYNRIFGEHLRATGKLGYYSAAGVLNTVSTICFNLLFLLVFKWGLVGYFRAIVLSEFVYSIFVTITGNIIPQISRNAINVPVLKTMLKYSIPLIPNSIMWWIMNAGDKYIINYYLGLSANGLYSLAMKIPTVLSALFMIFMQAWQLSAIEGQGDADRASFYNNIYISIMGLLTAAAGFVAIIVKPLFTIVIEESFFESWKYVPFLCIATVVNCAASFGGITYVVEKKTSKASWTTLVGAFINIALNFVLVKPLGLYGVAIGTCLGYLCVWAIRQHDAKLLMDIHYPKGKFLAGLILLAIQAVLLVFHIISIIVIFMIIIELIIVCLYRKELFAFSHLVFAIIHRRK